MDGTPKEEEGGERGEGRGRGHPLSFLSSALQRRREGEEFTAFQRIISFEYRAYLTFCCGTVQFSLDAGESLLFPPSFSPLPPCPRAGPFLFSFWGRGAVPFPSIPLPPLLLLSLLGSVGTGIAGGKRQEARGCSLQKEEDSRERTGRGREKRDRGGRRPSVQTSEIGRGRRKGRKEIEEPHIQHQNW